MKPRLGLRPNGVDVAETGKDGFILLSLKDGGSYLNATIDVRARRFRRGISYSGEFAATRSVIIGRGWLDRLIDEAAVFLLRVKGGEP